MTQLNEIEEAKKALRFIIDNTVPYPNPYKQTDGLEEAFHIIAKALAQLAALREDYVMVSKPVVKFLLGEDLLRGCFFGERPPTEKGQFWWRKELLAAAQPTEKQDD